ncbi:MAG: hypothetical protein ACM35G_00290 [Planctomycetaceae bacterium]
MASSTTRSQQTWVPSAKAIRSEASICQVWWGAVARSDGGRGRRGGGAGPSPASRNQRRSVLGLGQATSGRRAPRATRIRTAPHVGCWRRRASAASRT